MVCNPVKPQFRINIFLLQLANTVFLLMAHSSLTDEARAEPQQPNIVVLFADDMGFSDIGCFGSEIETPHLDQLAENGLRFSHFYNTGRCCPSRASIMTGLYPHQADIGHMAGDTGVPGYRDRLSFGAVTIAEVLGQAGYHTMMSGKWHLGWRDEGCPTARGFEQFYGTRGYIDSYFTILPRTEIYLNEKMILPVTERPVNHLNPDQEWYTTDVFTDYALHFIDNARQTDDRPFFLYLAYNAPHFPLHAKPEDLKKYRGKYREGWAKFRQQRYERLVELGIVNESWQLSPLDVPEWHTLTDIQKDDLDFKMALFAAIVDRLDQNIGRVVNHLEQIGELDNTLIFFVSDNGGTKETGVFGIKGGNGPIPDGFARYVRPGEKDPGPPNTFKNYESWAKKGGWSSSYGQGWANLSNVPFRLYKRFNHEGGISAPMIVHWPQGVTETGTITHQVGHLIDIMATCVDVADADYPVEFNSHDIQPMEGKSLRPLFGGNEIGDRTLYWEHEGHRAVRDGKWKLVAVHSEPWELYDMSVDRTELNNVSSEQPDITRELSNKWDKWASRVNVLPPEEVQRLRKELNQKRNAARKPKRITVKPDAGNLATLAKVRFSTPLIGRDQNESIQDGVVPKQSSDKQTVHRSWWPEKGPTAFGSQHWARYDFEEDQTIDNVSVFWFHDHPNGGCKVPQAWRLKYLDGDQWKHVTTQSDGRSVAAFGRAIDQFNEFHFDPVQTKALKIEVWLQEGASAGIYEWRINPASVSAKK